MREHTETLIERLSREAEPVKPLSPPMLRAASLLIPLLGLMTAIAMWIGQADGLISHLHDPIFMSATIGSLLTGVCAFVAALNLSIPGRSAAWAWLPIPPAAVWLSANALQCVNHIATIGLHDFSPFASADCFVFIMMTGTAIAVATYLLVRNTIAANTLSVTALIGLSAATLGMALLTFFHPPGTNPVDFLTHLTATIALVLFMVTAGRGALEPN